MTDLTDFKRIEHEPLQRRCDELQQRLAEVERTMRASVAREAHQATRRFEAERERDKLRQEQDAHWPEWVARAQRAEAKLAEAEREAGLWALERQGWQSQAEEYRINDADYHPRYQDEYQRLWHKSQSQLAVARAALDAAVDLITHGGTARFDRYQTLRNAAFVSEAGALATPDKGDT